MLQVVQLVGLFVFLFVFFMFCVEAWHASPEHGVCCTLVPLYVFYFAFIHSRRAAAYRYLLFASMCLMLTVPVAARAVSYFGAGS